MIGLVRLSPPAGGGLGVEPVNALPPPPAARYSGVVVLCDGATPLARALDWYAQVRSERPAFALGIVARPEICFRALGAFTHRVSPVLAPDELIGGRLPHSALEAMFESTLEVRIMEEMVREHGGHILAERSLLVSLISRAVYGGTVKRAARDTGQSVDSVERRLGRLGLRPGRLRSWVRVRAYELRIEYGATRASALAASGWRRTEDFLRVRRRVM
jgi:hypothetical protein